MAFLRARRGSVVWLAGIELLAVVLAVLAAIPLLRGDDPGTEGSLVGEAAPAISADDLAGRHWTLAEGEGREVIGPLGPARMAEIVEELIGPA